MPALTPARWLACTAAEVPPHDAWLCGRERSVQAGLRFAPRRSSWRLGRWTAKQLLLRSLELEAVEVRAAEDGAPEAWVDEVRLPQVLSITHREGVGVAALGPAPLGIDLEAIEPRAASMLETFFTPEEQALVARAARPELVANLVWSAKESLLKRLRVGLRRDTRSVQVSLRDDSEGEWRGLVVYDAEADRRHVGWWRALDGQVLTFVSDTDAPPVRFSG